MVLLELAEMESALRERVPGSSARCIHVNSVKKNCRTARAAYSTFPSYAKAFPKPVTGTFIVFISIGF